MSGVIVILGWMVILLHWLAIKFFFIFVLLFWDSSREGSFFLVPLPFAIPGKADTAFSYTLLIALHIIVMKLIISLLDGATTSKILGWVYAGSHIILSEWVIDG